MATPLGLHSLHVGSPLRRQQRGALGWSRALYPRIVESTMVLPVKEGELSLLGQEENNARACWSTLRAQPWNLPTHPLQNLCAHCTHTHTHTHTLTHRTLSGMCSCSILSKTCLKKADKLSELTWWRRRFCFAARPAFNAEWADRCVW